MRKIVTIHQPNYLPWIGLFSKIKKADCFIIADTFPYTNHSVTNRNKIRTADGWVYLTVPISRDSHMSKNCSVRLPVDETWKSNHWKSIQVNYVKTTYFKANLAFFEELYAKKYDYLWEINIDIIRFLLKSFKIDVEVIKSSDLNVDDGLHQTDAIIALLKAVKAESYLSGPSGKDYLDISQFKENGIALKYFNFQHPVYKQRFPGFIPEMSAVDLLFNTSPDAANKLLTQAGSIEDFKLL